MPKFTLKFKPLFKRNCLLYLRHLILAQTLISPNYGLIIPINRKLYIYRNSFFLFSVIHIMFIFLGLTQRTHVLGSVATEAVSYVTNTGQEVMEELNAPKSGHCQGIVSTIGRCPKGEEKPQKCALEAGIKIPDDKKQGLSVKPNDIKGTDYWCQILDRDKRHVFNMRCGGRGAIWTCSWNVVTKLEL